MIKVVLKDIVNIAVINCEPRLIHIFFASAASFNRIISIKIYIYITMLQINNANENKWVANSFPNGKCIS